MKSNHFFRFNLSALQIIIVTSILIVTFLTLLSCGNEPAAEQSILIKNGIIVNYNRSFEADILIKEEKIVQVGKDIKVNKSMMVIDATGLEILPGGIDPHVHITGPQPGEDRGDRPILPPFETWIACHAEGSPRFSPDHRQFVNTFTSLM